MFSTAFILTTIKQLAIHPSATLRFFRGGSRVGAHLDKIRLEKWKRNPVQMKRVRGIVICLNVQDTAGPSPAIGADGVYEIAETALMQKVLRPGMTFVDAGANVGWYTLLAASRVGPAGNVVAFEPGPICYMLLTKSVELNGFQNVTLLNVCLSNHCEKNLFWLDDDDSSSNSLVRGSGDRHIEVETVTLDVALSRLGLHAVDVLKVDVEQLEPEVLEGASNLTITHIMMEWRSSCWKQKGSLLHDIMKKYDVFRIVNSPFLLKSIDENDLMKIHLTNVYLKCKG
jgi:FkbM family methyltransferase